MHGTRFANVEARLGRSLVGPSLQAYVPLATCSELLFTEFTLVLFRHLGSERRPVETLVETLFKHTKFHISNNEEITW